jgi:hypothetical protein
MSPSISLLAPSGRQIDYRWSQQTRDAHGTWVTAHWAHQAYPVSVRIGLSPESDDIIATGLRLGPGEAEPAAAAITVRSLRALPLNDILYGLQRLTQFRGAVSGGTEGRQTMAESLGFAARASYRGPRVHPGPRGHQREHFEEIARLYNEIRARNPHSPMQELAKFKGYSLPQMRRFVLQAEKMGLRVNRPQAQKPVKHAAWEREQITHLKTALVLKDRGEEWARALLGREKGYKGRLFDAPPDLIEYVLEELNDLPDRELPVRIDEATGEVRGGEFPGFTPDDDRTEQS